MFKRILKCIKGYRTQTILTPVFMVGEVFFELIIPMLMSACILDYLTFLNSYNIGVIITDIWELKLLGNTIMTLNLSETNMTYLLICGLILFGCGCLSFTFGSLSGIFSAKASAGFAGNLRRDLFFNVQQFSFANIDKFSTSSLVTRLTTDVTNVQNSFMMIIRMGVRAPLMLIVSLIFSINAFSELGQEQMNSMAISYAIILAVMIFALGTIMLTVVPLFKKIFKRYDALNESVQENVKGMRVVKSYVREEFEKVKFGKASEQVRKDFTKAEKILAFNNPIIMGCMYATQLAVFIICGRYGIWGNNPEVVSKLQMLVAYSISVLMSFMMLSFIFVMVTMSLASAKRIYEVLDEKATIHNPENPVFDIKDGSVEFRNVSFKYDEKSELNALDNINLKIKSGETIGIIGGTGSSKTTLISLISRLYDATEGEVLVGDRNVKEYDLTALRDNVSVVLQKNLLFSGTISENIRWGDKNASDEEVQRVCKLAQADEFIQTLPDKYNTFIEQGGTNVSGGQKQRLCIARALLKKPKILILDDSTSAVDTKTDALIQGAFKNEIPDTTKIIIAQRVASIKDADRIIVMDGGKINGIGNHDELIKSNNIYQEVYYTQNKVNIEEGGDK